MRFVLLEATPWKVADGLTQAVRLAGGGAKPYSGLRGFTDWRAGVATFPYFTAAAGFGENGWTGAAIPQTAQIRIFPSDEQLRSDLLSLYHWKGAAIEIRSGDDDVPGVYLMECTGIVDSIASADGVITLTVADVGAKLNVPVVSAKFAGTGGIEGPTEAEGRPKRRSWGFVRNVEGFLLDKPNNIFEFGDPSFPLNSFVTVRDMGRDASPSPTTVTWQGSIAATLTALQASTPAQGSCVVAPSIACVKWWTVPAGPLTADIQGEVGSGYVNKVADIASRMVDAVAPLRGPELVSADTEFDTATGWTLGGTGNSIGSGVYNPGTATNNEVRANLSQVMNTGEKYEIKVQVNSAPTNLTVAIGRAGFSINGIMTYTALANGANVIPLTVGAGVSAWSATVSIYNNGTAANSPVSSVSVKQVLGGVTAADVTAINAIRASVAGLHIGDASETVAQALDRLLIPVNVLWGINPDGSIRLSEVQLTTSAETLTAVDVERADTLKPIWQTKLGYKKNHRKHNASEISAALLLGEVSGPPESTVFTYDYLAAADPSGQFPRVLNYKLLWGDGTVLTTGVTWRYRVINGTVNGFTNSSSWQTATGTGLGSVSVSSLGSDTATIEVEATFGGEKKTTQTPLSKTYAAAPTGGGGGGGGSPTLPLTKNSGFASINSTTFTDLTGWLPGTMPTGKTTAQLAATLDFAPIFTGGTGSWTVELKWQRDVGGVATDIGSPAVVSGSSSIYPDPDNGPQADDAVITNNKSDTGLTAGASYQWRLMGRLTSGTRTHFVTGTSSVTAP